jgi:hypothetical protein
MAPGKERKTGGHPRNLPGPPEKGERQRTFSGESDDGKDHECPRLMGAEIGREKAVNRFTTVSVA